MTLCIHTGTNTQTNQPVSSPQIKKEIGEGNDDIFGLFIMCLLFIIKWNKM